MKLIQLTRGKQAIVSDEDYELVSPRGWRAQKNLDGRWYAVALGNPWLSMHRFIMQAERSDQVVCHINEDGLDNRRENLLLASNSMNQHLRFKDAKGYHFETRRRKWKAMISLNGKATYLGRFDTEAEAAEAYKRAKDQVLAGIFGKDEDEENGTE